MTQCEGPGASAGQTSNCPHPELNAKSCQGDIWLCFKCEKAHFDKDTISKTDNPEKSEKEIDIYHDAEDSYLQNEIMNIGSIIFTKSNKSYPNWPGKILNIHSNNDTCLVEFFHTQNWMLVPMSKLHKFENLEAFKSEASKSKFRNDFEHALKEANIYFEKMRLPISSKTHPDQNDSTNVKVN